MNNSTAVEMARNTTGRPIQLSGWNRNDPVERLCFENRRLEKAQPFRQPVKVRRNSSRVTPEEKRFLWGK